MRPARPPCDETLPAATGSGRTAAILFVTSLAIVMLNVAPAAEALLRQDARMTAAQAGLAFFVELAAMGLATPLYWRFGRVDAARLARWACAAIVAGNLLSSICLGAFAPYAGARALTGVGAGLLMILGMTAAARARDPQRLFALITFAQLASGAVLLWLFPLLAGAGRGLRGVFYLSALLGVMGLFAAAALSVAGRREAPPPDPPAGRAALKPAALAVAFALLFNLAVGGLWPYVAEYGVALAMDPQAMTVALGGATAAGLAGAAIAFVAGDRWGHRPVLLLGYLGIALGAGLLHVARGAAGFAAGSVVFMLAWNFSVPYVFAAVATRDAGARLMSAMNMAFAFGLAAGPPAAGAVIDAGGLGALLPCVLVGLAAAAWPMLRITRSARARGGARASAEPA